MTAKNPSMALGVVVDCSGSMLPDMPAIVMALAAIKARADAKGVKMAVWASFEPTATGRPAAKSIMAFGSSATSAARDLAKLNGPAGGTILAPAIVAAVAAIKKVIASERVVVVIWDGYAGDETSIAAVVGGEKQVKVLQILMAGADTSPFAHASAVFGTKPIAVGPPGVLGALLAQLIG